jgi:HD-GYP domain-containing protein (c-di-GMP phosphodiesterase class II)
VRTNRAQEFSVSTGDQLETAGKAFLHFSTAADEFECYKNAHATRIAAIADALALGFHMATQDRRSLRVAALMHDLGEVVMEREYIQRAGVLTDEERRDLARHPVIGEQECARAGADRPVQLLVRWHHEWWNGVGYPDALTQKQIPLGARILRAADAYASLTDHRPYRAALTEDEARQQLVERAGIEFDPHVVQMFLSLPEFDDLKSFAPSADEQPEPSQTEWNLFSSFMK